MNEFLLYGRHINLQLFEDSYLNFLYNSYVDLESRKLYTSDTGLLDRQSYYKKIKNNIKNKYHIFMIINYNINNNPIGFIYSHDFDVINGITYTTIFINKQYRSKGVALESGILFFNYLFSSFAIRKIYCTVFNYNKTSFNFLNKLGFKIEGKLKDHKYFNGKYHDFIYLSLDRNKFLEIFNRFEKYVKRR